MSNYINPFGGSEGCYKGNLHSHSTLSDGQFTVAELIKLYGEQDYEILALTDHNKAHNLSDYNPGKICLINGVEVNFEKGQGHMMHLLGLNVNDNFAIGLGMAASTYVQAIKNAGGEIVLAHPVWYKVQIHDIARFADDIIAFEIYNTGARGRGKPSSGSIWEPMLELNSNCTAIAADDIHGASALFGGWTMICAEEKSPEAIINAIKNGKTYSSTGPEFYKLDFDGKILRGECSEVEEIICISNKHGTCGCKLFQGMNAKVLNGRYIAGEKLSWTSFETIELPENCYFRVQIKDKNGNYAWSNPFWRAKNA